MSLFVCLCLSVFLCLSVSTSLHFSLIPPRTYSVSGPVVYHHGLSVPNRTIENDGAARGTTALVELPVLFFCLSAQRQHREPDILSSHHPLPPCLLASLPPCLLPSSLLACVCVWATWLCSLTSQVAVLLWMAPKSRLPTTPSKTMSTFWKLSTTCVHTSCLPACLPAYLSACLLVCANHQSPVHDPCALAGVSLHVW